MFGILRHAPDLAGADFVEIFVAGLSEMALEALALERGESGVAAPSKVRSLRFKAVGPGQPAADAGKNLGDAAGREAELFGDLILQLAVDGDAAEDLLVATRRDARGVRFALFRSGHCSAFLF